MELPLTGAAFVEIVQFLQPTQRSDDLLCAVILSAQLLDQLSDAVVLPREHVGRRSECRLLLTGQFLSSCFRSPLHPAALSRNKCPIAGRCSFT